MNSSRKLAAALLASTGLALTVSLAASNTAASPTPAPGMKSDAGTKTPLPNTNTPAKPNQPAHDPSVSAMPADPKAGSGMTPGAANSGSGVGGRETVAPTNPATDPSRAPSGSAVNSSGVSAPGAHGFSTMDTDRDGRISLTEFASPSASWLRSGTTGAATSNDSVTGQASSPTGTAAPRDSMGHAAAPGSSAPLAGPSSATNNTQLFQRADTNHDGFLSPAEVEAYRAPTTLER